MTCYDFDRALVRLPAPTVIHGLRGHDGPGPRYKSVVEEHRQYIEALEEAGVVVFLLEPIDEHPDAIFVEDPALTFTEGAVLLRPGTATRADEPEFLRAALLEHFGHVGAMEEGHVDGGDVLVTPDLVLIGLSERTDRRGAAALGAELAELGLRTQAVAPPRGALHLKSQATLLDEETMLVTPAIEQSGILERFRQIVVDERELAAANVLRVNEKLIVPAQHKRTAERLAREGFDLLPIDTTHIERLDGGLTCCSLRWRSRPPAN